MYYGDDAAFDRQWDRTSRRMIEERRREAMSISDPTLLTADDIVMNRNVFEPNYILDEKNINDIHKYCARCGGLIENVDNSVNKNSVDFNSVKKVRFKEFEKNKEKEVEAKVASSEVKKNESNGSDTSETSGGRRSEKNGSKRSSKAAKGNGHKQEGNSGVSVGPSKADVPVKKMRSKGNAGGNRKSGETKEESSGSLYDRISQIFTKGVQRKYTKLTKDNRGKAGKCVCGLLEADGSGLNERKIQQMLTQVGEELPIYCMFLSELLGGIFTGPEGRKSIKEIRSRLKRRVSSRSRQSSRSGKAQMRDKGSTSSN